MKGKLILVLILFSLPLSIFAATSNFAKASTDKKATAPTALVGRIWQDSQTGDRLWYVNPVDNYRYYFDDASSTYALINKFAVSITPANYAKLNYTAIKKLSGRFLKKTQNQPRLYYINPDGLTVVYLSGADAARARLQNLAKPLSSAKLNGVLLPPSTKTTVTKPLSGSRATVAPSSFIDNGDQRVWTYNWLYKNAAYSLALALSKSLADDYAASQKTYRYQGSLPNDWHEAYYGMFLQAKNNDNTIDQLTASFQALQTKNNLTNDQLVELMAAFVQNIPYDHAKSLAADAGDANVAQNYPYETLFKNSGVCSDKSFLLLLLVRKLGYGALIFDFPDKKHTAVGIQCSKEYSVYSSGYCYIETTNFFPIGIVPQVSSNVVNQAQASKDDFAKVFDPASLGQEQALQKTVGTAYYGIKQTVDQTLVIRNLRRNIDQLKIKIDALAVRLNDINKKAADLSAQITEAKSGGDIAAANGLIEQYNAYVAPQHDLRDQYNQQIKIYNTNINQYNQLVKDFYQLN